MSVLTGQARTGAHCCFGTAKKKLTSKFFTRIFWVILFHFFSLLFLLLLLLLLFYCCICEIYALEHFSFYSIAILEFPKLLCFISQFSERGFSGYFLLFIFSQFFYFSYTYVCMYVSTMQMSGRISTIYLCMCICMYICTYAQIEVMQDNGHA